VAETKHKELNLGFWSAEDHAIFLKYCPSARDRCWHSMVYDTSTRPHEILDLKVKNKINATFSRNYKSIVPWEDQKDDYKI
jgi:hypothetical protein